MLSISRGGSSLYIAFVYSSAFDFRIVRKGSKALRYRFNGSTDLVNFSFRFSYISHSHLFSSGNLRGISFGSGSIGFYCGFIGVLMGVSYPFDLYKSERIFRSRSGIFDISSSAFSNACSTTLTKTRRSLLEYIN